MTALKIRRYSSLTTLGFDKRKNEKKRFKPSKISFPIEKWLETAQNEHFCPTDFGSCLYVRTGVPARETSPRWSNACMGVARGVLRLPQWPWWRAQWACPLFLGSQNSSEKINFVSPTPGAFRVTSERSGRCGDDKDRAFKSAPRSDAYMSCALSPAHKMNRNVSSVPGPEGSRHNRAKWRGRDLRASCGDAVEGLAAP